MDTKSWTSEENQHFKNALLLFPAFSPTRFERIAEYVQKPVADVKKHYKELVDHLLKIGSSQVALSNGWTEGIPQSLYHDETIWDKEEHEWFMIGLKRFGKDWKKISGLVHSKNLTQVAIYGHSYDRWPNSKKNEMDWQRANDIAMVDTNVDSTGQQEPCSTAVATITRLDYAEDWSTR